MQGKKIQCMSSLPPHLLDFTRCYPWVNVPHPTPQAERGHSTWQQKASCCELEGTPPSCGHSTQQVVRSREGNALFPSPSGLTGGIVRSTNYRNVQQIPGAKFILGALGTQDTSPLSMMVGDQNMLPQNILLWHILSWLF